MKKKHLVPFKKRETGIFDESVRKLDSELQTKVWDIARDFELVPLLNSCCDETYARFVSGIENALGYIKKKAVDTSAVDYAAFMLSAAKTALAADEKSYKAAYTDMMKALGLNDKEDYEASQIDDYIEACDSACAEGGRYFTTGYSPSESDEDVVKLQQALAKAGISDKYGEELKADGIFGPKTYYAAMKLKKENKE